MNSDLEMKTENRKCKVGNAFRFSPSADGFEFRHLKHWALSAFFALVIVALLSSGLATRGSGFALPEWRVPSPAFALAGGAASIAPSRGAFVANPTITIAGTTADTATAPTTNQHEAQILWAFGTVSGTYSTCTVQTKTSFDGSNWLTLGSAATVTATSNTLNAWTILAQAPTTSVTTSSVSSTAALGFGQISKFTFACSGYGTSAPATITVIYR
jgi:hypothetical protein